MLPGRSARVARRAPSILLGLAVALTGLVGLQVGQPTRAAAAPPSTPSASPSRSSTSSPSPSSPSPSSPTPSSPIPTHTPSTSPTPDLARAVAAGPTAVDDVLRLQAQGYTNDNNVPFAANDRAGTAPLKLASTTFPDDQPGGGTVSSDHQGIGFGRLGYLHMLPPSSRMEFIAYGGPGTAVARYRIVDANGTTADALVTIVVGPGGGPEDVLGIVQGHPGAVDVLPNDIPGNNADGTPGTIDPTSVHFTTSSWTSRSTVSSDGRTLTDPDGGLFTADPATGLVTFVPKSTYRSGGRVVYVARDTTRTTDGTVEHHSYIGRIDLQIQLIDPKPVNDLRYTPHHASVTLPGVTDDLPGDPSSPLRPELTVFVLGNDLPETSTLYDHGRGVKVPGQGWWTIEPGGTITFTPVAAYVGHASTARYQVFDANGGSAVGEENVFVQPGPVAKADTATTAQNVTVAVDAPANDTPGKSANGNLGVIDGATVRFSTSGQPAGAMLSASDRALTVPGQGAWAVDPTTGVITFDPETRFVGKASSVAYEERDTVRRRDGRLVHNLTSSTVSVTVTALTPAAQDDSAATTFGRGVDVVVLGNDRPGAASAPLVPSSVRLRLVAGLPAGSQLSSDGRTLTVTGRGTYVARTDGVVVFTPSPGFTGTVPAAGYQVSDVNGTAATASITVRVTGAAVMRPTTATTRAGQPVAVDVLSNDEPPRGAGWDRSSVCVVAGTSCLKHATRSGVGSWTVDAEDGTITFASAVGFTGDAEVAYSVRDTVVGTYTSTLTVSVAPAREAKND